MRLTNRARAESTAQRAPRTATAALWIGGWAGIAAVGAGLGGAPTAEVVGLAVAAVAGVAAYGAWGVAPARRREAAE